jgi:ribosomal protein S18 acetylase RimI-like enzyme
MISASLPAEREALGRIAAEVGVFDEEEIATVYELFDEYAADPLGSGYYFLTYREAGQVLGFACYGPTPLTQGTYDLYWICTARAAHQRGVGRALLLQVDEEVRAAGGRLIIISTSGGPDYAAARAFYERTGCALAGIIPDYYKPGDDLYLYSRRVGQVTF